MSCRRTTWFIFLFGRTHIIRCFNFSFVCRYRSELIMTLLRIPLTRFLHCTVPEAVAGRPLRGPVANILFTASVWRTQASKWAKIYGVLTIRASEMLTFLSRTRAFGTVCLVRTSTTSAVLHCYCVERTCLTGTPVILVKVELPLPVGKARNSTRWHVNKKTLLLYRPSYCHDAELDGLRGTKTSFRRVGDPAEIWTSRTRYRLNRLAWCFAFIWFMASDVFGRSWLSVANCCCVVWKGKLFFCGYNKEKQEGNNARP